MCWFGLWSPLRDGVERTIILSEVGRVVYEVDMMEGGGGLRVINGFGCESIIL